MVREPLWSACSTIPQDRQANLAWVTRLVRWVCQHSEHWREVLRGSTWTTGAPARRALYSTNAPSWANAQECSRARWSFLAVTLCRVPVRSPRAIPREVRSAVATSFLAMTWLVLAACRASRRRMRLSARFADLVRSSATWSEGRGGACDNG
jgi:hypothetical protein